MNRPALRMWQKVLRETPKHIFDMRSWGTVEHVQEEGQTCSCGTTMCAAGTAGNHPWFRKRGFCLRYDGNRVGGVYFQGFGGTRAVMEFFGLDDVASYYIVSPNHTKDSIKKVCQRIDKVLAGQMPTNVNW